MPPRLPPPPAPCRAPSSCQRLSTTASSSLRHKTHTAPLASRRCFSNSSARGAQLIRRPHRPYQFTQLLTLSDGSTSLHRTTSPVPVYRSTKDTRNSPLWNPSNERMANVEEDEAGRLRAFRRKFGRGWDAQSDAAEATLAPALGGETSAAEGGGAPDSAATKAAPGGDARAGKPTAGTSSGDEWSAAHEDNLMDLIAAAGLASAPASKGPVALPTKQKATGKGKKK